eukprot:12901491-Prorocentrum_lima.AAC.1
MAPDLSQNGYGLLICTQPTGILVDCMSISVADVYSTHKDCWSTVGRFLLVMCTQPTRMLVDLMVDFYC